MKILSERIKIFSCSLGRWLKLKWSGGLDYNVEIIIILSFRGYVVVSWDRAPVLDKTP